MQPAHVCPPYYGRSIPVESTVPSFEPVYRPGNSWKGVPIQGAVAFHIDVHSLSLTLSLSLSLFVSCRGFKRHTRTNRTHTRATSIICRPLKCVMMRVKHVLRARVRLVTKYASHGNVRKRERVRGDGPAVRFSTGIPASISWAGVSWHFRLLRGHRGGRRWFSLLSSRW